MVVSFLALFFGLFSGDAGFEDLAYLLVIFVVAGLIYLWADRMLGEITA
jgi:hypothetical protein